MQETPATFMQFQDKDFKAALTRALRTVLILAVVGTVIAWIALGWRSAALFLVGAVISGTGIVVWQRLMGAILDWFVAHLLFSGSLLYVSLRGLNGSVYALIAGLGLALIALLIEVARLFKAWSH
jgi:Na+/H+-translocating membrane pyrophosphatase